VVATDWKDKFWASSRGRIVARLRRGPAAIDELAVLLGITPNGVRSHLATLEREGWIHPEGERRPAGPGKPAVLYALAPETESLLSNAYRPLLLALLAVLAGHERPARLDGLMRQAGDRLAQSLRTAVPAAGTTAERAVHLLTLLGGAAEAETRKGRVTIRGGGCPVGEAVAVTPAVCQAVAALLAGALGVPVRDSCDRAGRPSCRFELAHAPRARRRQG
jgi:predicted ArsR family transcriptional regulator